MEDALEQLQLLAVFDRARPERQVAVGLAEARAGRKELAVLTLRQAMDRTPDHPLIYGALGQIWLAQAVRGDTVALGKAGQALERAAATDSATSTVLTVYGRALLMDNQVNAAERVLQQAARRYPVDPAALVTYASVAERLNHPAAARTALNPGRWSCCHEPDFGARAASIARLSLRLNDRPAAAAWIARGLQRDPENAALQALDVRARDRSRSARQILIQIGGCDGAVHVAERSIGLDLLGGVDERGGGDAIE